ncbi:MAG: hypothetical protein JO154_13640 [Chitinophaga sp.]|uniref:hypothetical protein n=1 Tax=Chitinophaga sp. TaxID=1869181 RepID=UPI0025B8D189|nr:hypothetical protein [Chitinophaga sp.]MBV8253645.1 hypothetical protein [Chitinophaga sp.]
MEPNPILELIALPVKDLEVLKIGKVGEFSDLSYFSALSGSLSNQLVLILNTLYKGNPN